ncbi:MAG: ABC transporter ATP-binding protein/permease [Cellulomonadaceae bacterium]|nr:ABC transporter ATP-binding protein/permease [Cellulomonadaceae bacterium]
MVEALVPTFAIALATSWFVDTALSVFAQQVEVAAAYLPLATLILAIGLANTINSIPGFLQARLRYLLTRKLEPELLQVRANLAYQHIEDSDSWDLVERVSDELVDKILGGLNALIILVRNTAAVAAMFALLVAQVWWAAVAILVLCVPLFWLAVRAGRENYAAEVEALKYERRYSYYSEEVLTTRDGVEERTLFGYAPEITGRYSQAFAKAHQVQLRAELKTTITRKAAGAFLAIIGLLAILALINPVLSGQLSTGMFMGIVAAVFAVVEMVGGTLQSAVAKLSEAQFFLGDLTEFLALDSTAGATEMPAAQPIPLERLTFRNVSFQYPIGEHNVLNNVTFDLEPGKHYAFVGPNGAGKTTIAKLLTRLYDGYQGEILVNGIELRDYPGATAKAMVSVVHQDFARYQVSLADNIALGNVSNLLSPEKLLQVANKVSLGDALAQLPAGLDTPLGKLNEEGTDLAGGQWQKVAIARSFVSSAPVVILDEPTAALDPIAESEVYLEFENLMHGKTTIMISHRLGSTKLADKIFVIGQGTIVEQGSHAELMAQNGIYAQMFATQSKWYK